MKREQRKVCEIIKQTVITLCERGFTADNIEIRGVIGVTINNSEVLVIHINEDVEGCDDENLQKTHDLKIGASSASYRNQKGKNSSMSPSASPLSPSNVDAGEHLVFPVGVKSKNEGVKTKNKADINHQKSLPGNDCVEVADTGVTFLRIASVFGNATGCQTGDDDVTAAYSVVKQKSLSHQPASDDVINNSNSQSLSNNGALTSTERQKSVVSLKNKNPSYSDVGRDSGFPSPGSSSCRTSSQSKPCISLTRIDALCGEKMSILQPVVKELKSDEQSMEQSVSCSDQYSDSDVRESIAAGESSTTWPYCSNVSANSCKLRTRTGEKPFKCTLCSMKFSRLYDCKRHLRTHTGEKTFKCTRCSMKFSRSYDVKRHLRTHTGEKPFQCTHCSKAFSDVRHLNKHLNRCHYAWT